MMSSFINPPDESLKQISGPAPAYQSFTERKKLERQRRLVKGYRFSRLGAAYGERGSVRVDKRPGLIGSSVPDRQAFNASNSNTSQSTLGTPAAIEGSGKPSPSSRTFTEPPSRGYNPYS